MKELKTLLKNECDMKIEDDVLDLFLSRAESVTVAPLKCFVEAGTYSPYMWIVKSGIIRVVDMNGDKERTIAFGLPGTVFTLKHSFVKGLPSYYELWSCCESELLRVSRKDFDDLMRASHRFAVWMFHLMMEELFYQEKKNSSVANGPAKDRFEALYRHRPEIIEKVQQKDIASYLGISPEYLCRLKRKLIGNHRKQKIAFN